MSQQQLNGGSVLDGIDLVIATGNVNLNGNKDDEMSQGQEAVVPTIVPGVSKDDPRMVVNKYRHPFVVEHRGAIIQFLTYCVPGHPPFMGSIRIPETDHRYLKNYLLDNESSIKSAGIKIFFQYLNRTQSPLGVGEKIPDEQFGMTYSVQSNGVVRLNPNGKPEADIWVLDHPHLLETYRTALDYGGNEYVIVINAYMTLNEPHKRRAVVQQRRAEEAKAQENGGQQQQQQQHQGGRQTSFKSPSVQGGKVTKKRTRDFSQHRVQEVEANLKRLSKEVSQVKMMATDANFPKLPPTKPPRWHHDGLVPLKPASSTL